MSEAGLEGKVGGTPVIDVSALRFVGQLAAKDNKVVTRGGTGLTYIGVPDNGHGDAYYIPVVSGTLAEVIKSNNFEQIRESIIKQGGKHFKNYDSPQQPLQQKSPQYPLFP